MPAPDEIKIELPFHLTDIELTSGWSPWTPAQKGSVVFTLRGFGERNLLRFEMPTPIKNWDGMQDAEYELVLKRKIR